MQVALVLNLQLQSVNTIFCSESSYLCILAPQTELVDQLSRPITRRAPPVPPIDVICSLVTLEVKGDSKLVGKKKERKSKIETFCRAHPGEKATDCEQRLLIFQR